MKFTLLFSLISAIIPSLAATSLYSTSFEGKANKDDYSDSKSAFWKSENSFKITSRFAKTGKRSLHILGGKKTSYLIFLDSKVKNAKAIEFRAERWTRKGEFKFYIFARQYNKWEQLTDLSKVIEAGARMRSHIKLALPTGGNIQGLKFVSETPSDAGILIDDFELLDTVPKRLTKVPKAFVKPTNPLKLIEHNDVFVSGTDNTKIFRIPVIITAKNGTLIAAIDARRKNAADLISQRSIDITYKMSKNNGKTWSKMKTIADLPAGQGASDPSFILDRNTGEIFCFYNWMGKTREFRFYMQSSKDNGMTWSKITDFTDQVTPKEWNPLDFKFITSGRGIQTRSGELLHNIVHLPTRSCYLYGSKDAGKTWKLYPQKIYPADESKVIELNDGTLMVNSRVGKDYRWVHRSSDKGKTWESEKEYQLPDPRCNGSIIRYTSKIDGYAKNRLLFSNAGSQKSRTNLTIRISYDEGETWSEGKVVNPGSSAYSSLIILKNGNIGVLYENGNKQTKFASFSLEELTNGQDKLQKEYVIE